MSRDVYVKSVMLNDAVCLFSGSDAAQNPAQVRKLCEARFQSNRCEGI